MQEEDKMTQQRVADDLLFPLFRCISDTYKSRYNRNIWEQFENSIRSAAYTGKLKVFITKYQRIMPSDLQAQYTKRILSVIECGEDKQVLEWLRDETAYLVLLTRLANQKRVADIKEKMAANEEIDTEDYIKNPIPDENITF